jgi:4-amino-4-deoxy-L-arabinose transferase-like glycosyltransferase
LTGGYSHSELTAFNAGNSWQEILDNPVNAPFSIIAYLISFLHFGEHDILPLRIASAVLGLLTLTMFYWLVRHWHGERSAILGTVIFGCSAWFLHTERLGTPEVLLLLLLGLVAGSVWLKRTDNRWLLPIGFVLIAALLYVPGMIWFLIVGAMWQAKTLWRLFKNHFNMMIIGLLGLLALITPLVWSIYKAPQTAKVITGLPAEGWPNFIETARRLAQIPNNLFYHGPPDAEQWLGRLPLLDAFSIGMLLLGVYLYIRHWRLVRSKMVGTSLAVGALLASLGGGVSPIILMPFIYILIATGIGFMLDRWQKVFPRNTIAQAIGVGLISAAVVVASWYGLRHYFVAWPNAPATRQTFTIEQ